MKLLNVGAGGSRAVPAIFKGYEQFTLDIDSNVRPDIVCDAKRLGTRRAGEFDAIYCSHNLEHFYRHEVPQVLGGFVHVLKSAGFAYVTVPDLGAVLEALRGHEPDEVLYQSSAGGITFHDVIYGWGRMVAAGNEFYAHKTGFTHKSLGKALRSAGFATVMVAADQAFNLHAFGFKTKPARATLRKLGI